MKKCELCSSVARMYCDSDQAILCWDCDARVHSANFLVAKHSRTLLCHSCQSPTPWVGSGPKLGPTVSVCQSCVHSNNGDRAESGENHDDHEIETHTEEEDTENDDDEDDDDDSSDGDGDGDEGENQVVPLSSSAPLPPPPASSSSSSEESSFRLGRGREGLTNSTIGFSWKRTRN